MRGVWTIYRKELLDTLRDRKTLLFMLLLPTVVLPLVLYAMGRFTVSFVKARALETVVVAASPEAQRAYHEMAHAHFLRSEIGKSLRLAKSPVAKWMFRDSQVQAMLNQIPQEVFTDPEAYGRWARGLAEQARDQTMTREEMRGAAATAAASDTVTASVGQAVPEAMLASVEDFYYTTIRGVGLVNFVNAEDLPTSPTLATPLPEPLKELPNGAAIAGALRSRAAHGYLHLRKPLREITRSDSTTEPIFLYHDSTIPSSNEAAERVRRVVRNYREAILQHRIAALGKTPAFLEPVRFAENTDIATRSEVAMTAAGGLIPYLVLLFAYLGGIYPAIDLGAGEKERNTLETLLLSPASRTEIALGKFLVVLTTALIASLLGLTCLAVSVYTLMPESLLEQLDWHVSPITTTALALLTVPPAATFAGIFLSVSIFARTFKEAQNYMAPIGLVLIFPSLAASLPGVESSATLSMIPLVNVSLLAKDLLRGQVNWLFYALTFVSSALFAAACLALCVRMFNREEVLFRS